MIKLAIIIVLILIIAVIIARFFIYKKEVVSLNQQLDDMKKDLESNSLLKVGLNDKDLNLLASQINEIIKVYKEEQRISRRNNLKLKEEITNISHDFRTPLTSIKGFSELLSAENNLPEEKKAEYLDIIQKKIDNLLSTVNLFYDMSKIDSLDEQIKLEKLDFSVIFFELLFMFHQDFEEKNIKVDVVNEENFSNDIWADRKSVERVILNLIQNSLRYASSYLNINSMVVGDKLRVVFSNDTDKISEGDISQIFDRTYTADKSRSDGENGLGLYIAKQLVQSSGGEIKASLLGNEFNIEVDFPLFSGNTKETR